MGSKTRSKTRSKTHKITRKITRKSPDQSATLYDVGKKKTGNDGNMWIITQSSNGIKKWSKYNKPETIGQKNRKESLDHTKEKIKEKFNKLGKTTKSFIIKSKLSARNRIYMIHDNGGRPFKVIANNNGIEIYTYSDDSDADHTYDKLLLSINNFIGYWVGFDTSKYTNFHGNSILIQITKHKYIYVGWIIQEFETTDQIIDYVSPVGNSDVPYPVAYGETNVYFMLDMMYLPKINLMTQVSPINAENIYGEFYGHVYPENKLKKNKIKKAKILVKRKF
jgi:hypothetical protein